MAKFNYSAEDKAKFVEYIKKARKGKIEWKAILTGLHDMGYKGGLQGAQKILGKAAKGKSKRRPIGEVDPKLVTLPEPVSGIAAILEQKAAIIGILKDAIQRIERL